MRFNEKVLMFESCSDSPRSHVRNIVEVEIVRGQPGDEIHLEVILDDGIKREIPVTFGDRVPFEVRGGWVHAKRVAGEGPITVILFQE